MFQEFPKLPRLSRECVITEKIDGTNAQVLILWDQDVLTELESFNPKLAIAKLGDRYIFAGSRTRWITPENDNHGFAKWVKEHVEELNELGLGRHFGEWWGPGIQRGYGMREKRFSLFNAIRWAERDRCGAGLLEKQQEAPACCHVVPVLYRGMFTTFAVEEALMLLRTNGSLASPGFMRPEGVVAYHVAGGIGFKKTLENDELPKSMVK